MRTGYQILSGAQGTASACDSEKQTVIITGATGLIGSHLVARLLASTQNTRIICVARGSHTKRALDRVLEAIGSAKACEPTDRNLPIDQSVLARVAVIESDLTSDAECLTDRLRGACNGAGNISFWHCAANTCFVKPDRQALESANIGGAIAALRAAVACGAQVFNHVSTAYVAGTAEGDIPEELNHPPAFHNEYERTKHFAEIEIAKLAESLSLPFCIFRPGVVIAHSATFCASRYSGLYDLIRLTLGLSRMLRTRLGVYAAQHALRILAPPDATVHLVPVERAIDEMLWHDAHRSADAGPIVHVCSEQGTPVRQLMEELLPLCGIENYSLSTNDEPVGRIDSLFRYHTEPFAPYFSETKRFLRTRARQLGRAAESLSSPLTARELVNYAQTFLNGMSKAPAQAQDLVGRSG